MFSLAREADYSGRESSIVQDKQRAVRIVAVEAKSVAQLNPPKTCRAFRLVITIRHESHPDRRTAPWGWESCHSREKPELRLACLQLN